VSRTRPERPEAQQCTTPVPPQRTVRHRNTVEVVVGGVLGAIRKREIVIAGRCHGATAADAAP
jgi:hypothetical protein